MVPTCVELFAEFCKKCCYTVGFCKKKPCTLGITLTPVGIIPTLVEIIPKLVRVIPTLPTHLGSFPTNSTVWGYFLQNF